MRSSRGGGGGGGGGGFKNLEGMFKLHRHRSDRLGDKIEFKLSGLQAIKVPRGWDRLSLSIISEQSGKVIAKTGKATVRSGNCQWTETQSIWVSQDDTTKELEECLFRIVVSLASSRTAILGEVILNLSDCMSKETSGPLFLPLKKCDLGTTLQVKIQCSTSKSKFSFSSSSASNFSKEAPSHLEYQNNNDDLYSRSDRSDHRFESENRDTYFSASSSHRSSNSGDSFGRNASSPKSSLTGGQHARRQDSSGSHISAVNDANRGDEPLRSNQSSFNSRASGSSVHNQWQDKIAQTPRTPLLRPSDSSKEFDEVFEEIDELHDEVKMWERHSRQLKLDLESLKKEIYERSKNEEKLDRQLSAAYDERDSLKLEVEKLKAALEETTPRTSHISSVKNDDRVLLQKEMEDELKFQKESNAYLTQQLARTQESNIELVSILQELEEIIEKQKLEIANLSQKNHDDEGEDRTKKSFNSEVEWERKLALKEEEIVKLEEKLSSIVNNEQQKYMPSDSDLLNEIEILKNKVNELERDCNELTDENLELIFKLKKLSKDIEEDNYEFECNSRALFDTETPGQLNDRSFTAQVTEKAEKKGTTNDFTEDELQSTLLLKEQEIDRLQHSNMELEDLFRDLHKEKCQLEDELQSTLLLKEQELDRLQHSNKEQEDLLHNLYKEKCQLEEELESTLLLKEQGIDRLHHSNELEDLLHNLRKEKCQLEDELQSTLMLKEQDIGKLQDSKKDLEDILHNLQKEKCQLEDKLQSTLLLKEQEIDRLQQSNKELEGLLQNFQKEKCQVENELQSTLLLKAQQIDGVQHSNKELEDLLHNLQKEKCQLELKEQEMDKLQNSNKELEDLLFNLQNEKCQLEQKLASLQREYIDTSNHLQDVEHNFLVLTGNMELQNSANKTLEKKSTELESCKNELKLHVSELEQENVRLSKCMSGLEAQIRYITDEKESNRLELEDVRSLDTGLKREIVYQKEEMEMQKAELKQKLQESQKRLSEVQEESDVASRSNTKLQATIDSLMEECSSFQKLTGDLKRQKLELHQYITHVEVEVDELNKKNLNFCKQVELLEGKLFSMEKDIASKEKSLLSQLEHIFKDHKDHGERIGKAHALLSKIELEKTVELENLKRERDTLTLQMSSDYDDQEKIVSDALHEASLLRTEKAKLECNLQEANAKVKQHEVALENQQRESKNKIQELMDLLNDSKQSEEMLMADIKHKQRTIDSVKSSEEKYRMMASNVELKLKDLEREKQDVMEEISVLKSQLQKMSHLHNSVLEMESSLDKANFEKRKSEELFKSLLEEYEELKSAKESLMEKYSDMQKAVYNAEDDRRSRISLQEKVLRLESDLSAKEASYAQEAELKNELNQIKRTNSEYQRKIQSLEQENEELMTKVQIMEKAFMLRKTSLQDEKVGDEDADHEDVQRNHMSKVLLERVISEKQAGPPKVPEKIVNDNTDKVMSLESELKDMKERFLSMSLQYAEVEAQREQLVMQLKSVKKEKRWFS